MPGLTFLMTGVNGASGNSDPCKAQTLLLHGPHYRAHSAAVEPNIYLGWVAYDAYPVRVFSAGGCLIYLEGRIYNSPANAVERDLAAAAATALGPERDDAAIERFILANEGSYVVAMVRPETRSALVFSDPFCRLPLYYSADKSRLIVSREAKFIHSLLPAPAFDRLGCAQIVAFGLPLGDRTVLEGVKSFPDSGLLRADVIGGHVRWRLRTLCTWNLDDEDGSSSVTKQAGEFADQFVSTCRNWGSHADSQGNLVSLSGGHDSRAVAAGLDRSGTAAVAVTYRDPNGARENEVICARQLANALGMEWHCIDLLPPSELAYEELAWLKDGMNWSSMAFILGYLDAIVRRWGRGITYLSGDGGDDCLKVTSPRRTFRQVDDVVRYILEKETCIQPDRAEAILRVPAGALREEVRRLFESYPERDLARRIKHFKIFERGRRCYFEGEDRTRCFLWQDSPFYSLPLFRHCVRVPDRQKYYMVFCRQALLALSPAAAATPVTSSGHPPASWKYVLYHRALETALDLPNPLLKLVRVLTGKRPEPPYRIPESFRAYLQDQLMPHTALAALLDAKQVTSVLDNVNTRSFFCLWSVAMLEKAYRMRSGLASLSPR